VSEEIREISWKAQHRLHKRYRKLTARGKEKGKVVTAIGRELLSFIRAICLSFWGVAHAIKSAQIISRQ
jgi:hypothetical protein